MPELHDVIAEREFEAQGRPGGVTLRLGRPAPDPQGDWSCPFQTVGLGRDGEVHTAYGVDAVQALVLALQMARAQLQSVQAEHGLTWLDGSDLGLG